MVVNCAAISVPRACEVDPAVAMATNVPSSLVNWLLSFDGCDPFLIHLSTDQGIALLFFVEILKMIAFVHQSRIALSFFSRDS